MSEQFFTPAENTMPYGKLAIQGFAGSGKTFTAAEIARGLAKRIGSDRVVMFDTEKAARFLVPLFKRDGIQLMVRPSRTLSDLRKTMDLCEAGAAPILIIDSITHPYENFLEAYKEKAGRSRFEIQDWGILKPTWKREFSMPLVQSNLHIIMNGRAGYEYESEVNERGKREYVKAGIKMKVEGETAYEPDMLILMERYEEVLDKDKRAVWREAMILKDRSGLLDGKAFRNPSFTDFEPFFDWLLNTASAETVVAEPKNDGGLFRTEEEKAARKREVVIALEEIQGLLVAAWPGQSANEKKLKGDAIESTFGTRSWTRVEGMPLDDLRAGYGRVLDFINAWRSEQETAAA